MIFWSLTLVNKIQLLKSKYSKSSEQLQYTTTKPCWWRNPRRLHPIIYLSAKMSLPSCSQDAVLLLIPRRGIFLMNPRWWFPGSPFLFFIFFVCDNQSFYLNASNSPDDHNPTWTHFWLKTLHSPSYHSSLGKAHLNLKHCALCKKNSQAWRICPGIQIYRAVFRSNRAQIKLEATIILQTVWIGRSETKI